MSGHHDQRARSTYAADGRLTEARRELLEDWAARDEAELDRLARRWGAGVLTADLLGLPLLLLATSWRWPAVVLVWAAAVALLLVVGALDHHHRRQATARALAAHQRRLGEMVTTGHAPSTATAPPSPVRRTGLAF